VCDKERFDALLCARAHAQLDARTLSFVCEGHKMTTHTPPQDDEDGWSRTHIAPRVLQLQRARANARHERTPPSCAKVIFRAEKEARAIIWSACAHNL